MTYPDQASYRGVAGGTSPVPCPTPVAPIARVCVAPLHGAIRHLNYPKSVADSSNMFRELKAKIMLSCNVVGGLDDIVHVFRRHSMRVWAYDSLHR